MKKSILFFIILLMFSCQQDKKYNSFTSENLDNFIPDSYELKNNNIKQIRGQVLYMPIYSNIPHYSDSTNFDMSAFVAIHNTDFQQTITLQKVQYFNTKGKLVHDFLPNEKKLLGPLETVDFYVPYRDQSGTGANFLIEWVSDSLVTEPLIESVTINTQHQKCVAVLSQGKVIKEIK
ncbi:MAG: DUF3124 domain-containing protein [Bacteroidales bacterium]|nr:DUF3124 domain-containing protein [Bacteroidales bacterium]